MFRGLVQRIAAAAVALTGAKPVPVHTPLPLARAPGDLNIDSVAALSWDDIVQRVIMPQQVESILSGAWGGDLRDQQQLFVSMMDTWAKLADNVRVLEDAVIGAPWEVTGYTDKDGNVSPSAKERQELVECALAGMKPRPEKGELDRDGVLKLLARGNLNGHALTEILWERREHEGRLRILPRAMKRVGPRWYGYPRQTRELQFREPRSLTWQEFPENKFLIHVVTAHDGHPSQAARLRTLCKYWGGSTYGWEWLMVYANKFGMPFRWATYKENQQHLKSNLLAMLANLGAAGYGVFPEGAKLEMHEAKTSAGDLPYSLLLKLADQACDLVVRGETSTGGTEEHQGFSKGDVQKSVRRETLQGNCNNICITLQQFVRAVLMLNYGNTDEAPVIRCEIPEPEDAKKNAETDKVLNDMGLPMTVEELWRRHDKSPPAEGDAVLINGQLVTWKAKEIIRDPKEAREEQKAAEQAKVKAMQSGGNKPKQLAAAKAKDGHTLEEVMETLLINAVIEGSEQFEEDIQEEGAQT